MTLAALLALAAVGFAVGFVAGLVGIGGGVLIVPFLYFFYGHSPWSGMVLDPSLHGVVASATSLFIIIPTAAAGMATYARAGLVAWRPVLPIGVPAAAAAMLSALIAARIPAPLLKIFFGCFLLFTAAQLVGRSDVSLPGRPERHNLVLSALTGFAVGSFSALLGVGGGLVAIPLLMYVIRLDVARLAATSLAIVMFAATAGTVTYMVIGHGVPLLPRGYVGYVHIAAALPMIPGAMLAARWGAQVNQQMDATHLRWLFAALFLLMGLRIIFTNVMPLLAP
ncbi:MAG TPA: sulfite exporter TauE/SafE family protein [Longimicrobiales bacterium]|nr:sulfite exporter TauE/SafE family protein [Longimicrobiales bacterium]